MYPKLVICALLMLLFPRQGAAQDDLIHSYKCNFAKVKLPPKQRHSVAVRTGPGRGFRQADRLHSEQEVYTCNETRGWYKIFYSHPDGPCHSTSEKWP